MNHDTVASALTAGIFFIVAGLAARAARRRPPPPQTPPPEATDRRSTARGTPDRRREPEKRLKLAILIERCPDGMMWYADKVGQTVPFVRVVPHEQVYISREPEGYTNIVKMSDARLYMITEE